LGPDKKKKLSQSPGIFTRSHHYAPGTRQASDRKKISKVSVLVNFDTKQKSPCRVLLRKICAWRPRGPGDPTPATPTGPEGEAEWGWGREGVRQEEKKEGGRDRERARARKRERERERAESRQKISTVSVPQRFLRNVTEHSAVKYYLYYVTVKYYRYYARNSQQSVPYTTFPKQRHCR
jgi:hypothetical protein